MCNYLNTTGSIVLNSMRDRAFVDTNILIYLISDDERKKAIAEQVLVEDFDQRVLVVSTQVINEFVAVSMRKDLLEVAETMQLAAEFMEIFECRPVGKSTIRRAFDVVRGYRFSYWDSLIVAAALESHCTALYSEDLQHGQILEHLRVVNPFRISGVHST